MVSIFAIVGLYDTNRFADASARAEIINNEGFLSRAFSLGGDAEVEQLVAFLEKHPKEAESAVSAGARIAAKLADRAEYDVHWQTAYGLIRMSCAMEGKRTARLRKPCQRTSGTKHLRKPCKQSSTTTGTIRRSRANRAS